MHEKFNFLTEFQGEPPEGEVVGFRLKNGLTVVMMKRHHTPVVAVDIWYQVGSRNEQPGKSGFAHLFEHMMFEGSENVGKAEHMKLINDVGGMVNGSTTQDRTNYWEVVPSNQLELALWLEADRMRSLNITPENFENQRATVKEERRLRIDNQPYMRVLYELKDELAYSNYAYKHSVMGSMEDLDRATLQDVREFHRTYYRPNNAILAVVGDMQVEKAYALIRKYFEDIPAGQPIPPVDLTEPPQTAEKRSEYRDPFAPFPAYLLSYHIPERTHPDFYPLELIEKILFGGESSRLYRKLVEEKQLALHLFGGIDGKFGPSLFYIFAQIQPGHSLPELEEAILKEMDTLWKEAIPEKEARKAKNQVKADFVARQEMVRSVADQFCFYTMVFGNPQLFLTEPNRFRTVTREEIRQVASRYFSVENRTVLKIYPGWDTLGK